MSPLEYHTILRYHTSWFRYFLRMMFALGVGDFTLWRATFKLLQAKMIKHEKACFDNQYIFILFVFDTFRFLAPDVVDLLIINTLFVYLLFRYKYNYLIYNRKYLYRKKLLWWMMSRFKIVNLLLYTKRIQKDIKRMQNYCVAYAYTSISPLVLPILLLLSLMVVLCMQWN
jgi:hypothetical protein